MVSVEWPGSLPLAIIMILGCGSLAGCNAGSVSVIGDAAMPFDDDRPHWIDIVAAVL